MNLEHQDESKRNMEKGNSRLALPTKAWLLHIGELTKGQKRVVFLTEKYGLITAASNKNSAKAKFVTLQPFTELEIGLNTGKSMYQLKWVEIVPESGDFAADQQYLLEAKKFRLGMEVNTVIYRTIPTNEGADLYSFYRVVMTALKRLKTSNHLRLWSSFFYLQYLRQLGYGINVKWDCNRQPIEPLQHYTFSTEKGWNRACKKVQTTDLLLLGSWIQRIYEYQFFADAKEDTARLMLAKTLLQTNLRFSFEMDLYFNIS